MDSRSLGFDTETFDFIIDKGTTDAILCSKNAFRNIALTYKECQRVLKPNGVFLVISSGKPNKNQKHFSRQHLKFDLTVKEMQNGV